MSRSQVDPVGPGLTKQLEGLARSLARDADPEDLVQETLLQHHIRGDEARDLAVWSKQVLRNCFRMRVRRGRRRRQRESTAAELAQQCQANQLGGQLDQWLDQEAFIDALKIALAQLDEPFRSVIRARFYDKLSAKEIAERKQLAAGTVRWQTHEGLRRLRASLDRRFHSRELWLGTLLAVLVPQRAWALDSATRRVPTESTMPHSSIITIAKPVLLTLAAGMLVAGVAMQSGTLVREASTVRVQNNGALASTEPFAHQPGGSSPEEVATAEPRSDAKAKHLFNKVAQNLAAQSESTKQVEDHGIEAAPACHFEADADCDCPFKLGELNDVDPADELDESELIRDVPKQLDTVERVHLATTGLAHLGPATNAFKIIECGDFQCPFCEEARSVINVLLKDNPGIDYYYAHNPLKFHKQAAPAARAAVYVQRQYPKLYWRFFERLYDRDLKSTADILDVGDELGIDRAALESGISDLQIVREVERQAELCRNNRAMGTPTFFVEGIRVPGARPLEEMQVLVDHLEGINEAAIAGN